MVRSVASSTFPDVNGSPAFLAGGELGGLICAHDWPATPLGPIEAWPQSLRTAVELMLGSRQPVCIGWGPDSLSLYNDGYIPILGGKHPQALGRPCREVFAEIWDRYRPIIAATLAGEAQHLVDQPLPLSGRPGVPPMGSFTFSWTPLRDDHGKIAGFYCVGTETTDHVRADQAFRRLFEASPTPFLVLAPDAPRFTIMDANRAYLAATMRSRAELIGRGMFEAFPDNPDDAGATGVANLRASLDRALTSKRPDTMPRQKYDIPRPGGGFEERWWEPVNSPILDASGNVTALIHHVKDATQKQRSEIALRESETRYRTLFETIDVGFCIIELIFDEAERPVDYRFIEVNPAFESQAGVRNAAGGTARALIPGLEEHWFEIYGRVALTGAPARFENGSDAMGRWFDVHAVRIGEPEKHRVAVLFKDITQRRRTERALQQLNETLETQVAQRTAERDRIWQLSPDLMCVAKTDGTLLSVNPVWERLLGWSPEWLAGRNAAEIKHPGDAERTAAELARLAAGGYRTLNFEDRYRHRDGSWLWISWVCEPEGELIYCIGRDITAEKERQARLEAAEAARRETDVLYRAYFENTPEALFVIGVQEDGGFVVEQINPAHEADVGLKLAEIRGKRIEDILPPGLARRVLRNYNQVIETGEILQYREVFDLGDEPQHWDTLLVPVRDAQGRITRLIGSSRNVTRQVMAEEALRQAQKMEAIGQLTGGVAHDFNNLLSPIVGSLDLLQRIGVGGEREKRLIAGAAQSAERAKTLVQRLLAFARRQPLQPVAVDIAKLVEGMGDLIASTVGPQIRVVVEAPDDLRPARADPNQLEMALLNLAVNARDAMPDGGTLRISASAEAVRAGDRLVLGPGAYVRLSVADTGVGMDEATLRRAIEPFFSTKGVGRGTGLGLSMAHGLASQLGGALTIRSRRGLGTNVELWLPVSEPMFEAGDAAPAPPVERRAGTVLLVDDEELVRTSTADMLADLGYHVVEAGSAEEALARVQDGLTPDVIITDHLMPGMSGTDLVRRLREAHPDLPALVVSGYAEVDGLAPDLPRLAKPFRLGDLAASLEGLA